MRPVFIQLLKNALLPGRKNQKSCITRNISKMAARLTSPAKDRAEKRCRCVVTGPLPLAEMEASGQFS